MRMTFDDAGDASRSRSMDRKKVGRKHNHTPSSRVIERRKAGKRRNQAIAIAQRRKHSALVAAYWRGEIDCHP